MQTIAIVNEKGGTGKTTTAVNLSAAIGEIGRKVLLVDLDGQAASSRWLGVEDDTSFADALWAGTGLRPLPDVAQNVSLVPGSGKLDSVAHDLRPTQGGQLRKLLGEATGFDYAIIDCPPSLGNRLIGNALLAASHAVVPVETSILALDGLKILLTTFQDIRDGFGHEIILAGALACRYDARTKLSRLILEELRRALPGKVFRTVIRENVRVRECPASGQSILTFAPESHAAEDYRSLAKELTSMGSALSKPAPGADEIPSSVASPDEQQSIDQMRQQVDAMLRQFCPVSDDSDDEMDGLGTADVPEEAPAQEAKPPRKRAPAKSADAPEKPQPVKADGAAEDQGVWNLDEDLADDAAAEPEEIWGSAAATSAAKTSGKAAETGSKPPAPKAAADEAPSDKDASEQPLQEEPSLEEPSEKEDPSGEEPAGLESWQQAVSQQQAVSEETAREGASGGEPSEEEPAPVEPIGGGPIRSVYPNPYSQSASSPSDEAEPAPVLEEAQGDGTDVQEAAGGPAKPEPVAEPVAAAPTGEPAPDTEEGEDTDDDYPALRAMVREMQTKDAKGGGKSGGQQSPWRRLLRKKAGV
ncbi:MAG: ParA family protein [Planctomycetota bacterium]|jgi:chromosome partitioning protein